MWQRKKNTKIQQQGSSIGELTCPFTRHGLTVVLIAAWMEEVHHKADMSDINFMEFCGCNVSDPIYYVSFIF